MTHNSRFTRPQRNEPPSGWTVLFLVALFGYAWATWWWPW